MDSEDEEMEVVGTAPKKQMSDPKSKSKNRKGAKEIWRRKKQLDVELGNLMKKITALKQSMILPDDDNAAIEMLISQLNRLQPAIDRLIESLASENQREELSTRRLLTELSTRENKKADALRDLQKLLQDRDKCLEELKSIPLPPPSLFKDCEVFKDVCTDFVDYHTLRSSVDSPPCNLEVPPTLVCRAFEDFICKLKSLEEPTVEFISIANQLAAVQSYCHTQDERVICDQIQKIMSNKAFCGDCKVGPVQFSRRNARGTFQTDISFCVDILCKDTCIASIEFKKDMDEATRENIGYFVNMNSNKMFLISMFDGHCDVSGAIRMKKDGIDHIVVSPLAESVNFFLHPIDEIRSDEVMLKAAKFLQALAAGIVSLKDEYQRSPSTFSAASAEELFALLPQFNGEIRINKRLASLTFGGISQGGSSVVVKFFAQKYGIAVQRCLHNAGLAPEVLKEVKVGRVWSACVMTNVEGKTLFECLRDNSLTEDAKKDICKQLSCIKNVLTSEGYVHGDLRSSNIIVAANNKLCVVDFSWAGKSLDVRYPWSLNCSSIRWHPGVGCGKKISTEHDNFLIDILIEDLSGTSSKSQT